MNILLTGGTGYIGSHTAISLVEAGHKVVLFDNLCKRKISTLEKLCIIIGDNTKFNNDDIDDTALFSDILQSHTIDAVVNCAGLKAVVESVQQPLRYFSNNVVGTISLLRSMQTSNARIIVLSSGATVYGNPQYLPIDENHPIQVTNPYGRTKPCIDEILADVMIADPGWHVVCLRYFNPVGSHSSGLTGKDPNGIPNNLMPYIARVDLGELPYVNVFGNDYPTPDGTGVRDYIHVMDLAEGHVATLNYLNRCCEQADEIKNQADVYNLGTGEGYSVLDMIRMFEVSSCQSVPYKILHRRTKDVAICCAHVAKTSRDLQWSAQRTLQSMCNSTRKFKRSIS